MPFIVPRRLARSIKLKTTASANAKALVALLGATSLALFALEASAASMSCNDAFLGGGTPSAAGIVSKDPSKDQPKANSGWAQTGVAFRPGYGLSASETALALQMPQTRDLARALLEAIAIADDLDKSKTSLLEVFQPTYPQPEIDAAMARDRASWRSFPAQFFNTHLRARTTLSQSLHTQYERLHRIFQQFRIGPVSDEALLLLAYATRNFATIETLPQVSERALNKVRIKAILDVIHRLNDAKRLPQLKSFLNKHNGLFVEFAVANRERSQVLTPALDNNPNLMSTEEYRSRLTAILARTPDISLEGKMNLAERLLEPDFEKARRTLFSIVREKRFGSSNYDRWREVGVPILGHLYFVAIQRLEKAGIYSEEPTELLARIITELGGGRETRETKVIVDIVNEISTRHANAIKIDEPQTMEEIAGNLKELTAEIKLIVQEHDRIERQRAADELRATIERLGPGETVVASKNKQGQRMSQGPSLGRAARRALLRAQQGEAAQATPRDESSANDSQALVFSEPAVWDVKLDDIVAGEGYWFEQFNLPPNVQTKRRQQNPELVLQDVVFSKDVIAELKDRRQELEPWVRAFLIGRTTAKNASGLKLMKGIKGTHFIWEIKIKGGDFRIIVEHEKSERTWTWVAFLPHPDVEDYLKNNYR